VVFIRDDGRDKRTILRNLTFRGDNGRIVAVVGRSGSGKTTLAFHLNRLLEPAAGKVLIAERDATDMPIHEVRRTVGMTFQRVDLQLFGATVIEDVAFGLIQRDIPEREARDRSIAAMRQVGIDPELFAERSPSTLSTGEKRRAALAGVLVMDPAVIVFDEPTSGLDAAGVDSLEDTLSALRTAGKALIVITHDLDFARDIADSVLVMDAGSGVQTENIEAISEVAPV
jgi:energy-coupling factor transport system ATP-binding protein